LTIELPYYNLDFFNNLKLKGSLYSRGRLNVYYSFVQQGWHLVILNNYLKYYKLYCQILRDENNYKIPRAFENSMNEFGIIFNNWKNENININNIFLNKALSYHEDIQISKISLFMVFNKVLKYNIINFNCIFKVYIFIIFSLIMQILT